MSLIADGILIATCLTTAVYCYVLSRRLQNLLNTDEGIGQQIKQFNVALEETREAVAEIRTSARQASDRLTKDIAAARKQTRELKELLEAASKIPVQKASELAADRSETQRVVEEPVVDIDEREADLDDEFLEIADQPLDVEPEILTAPLGEQQLGFLPGASDELKIEDAVDTSPKKRSSRTPKSSGKDASAQKSKPEDDDDENLLRVERMAL